MLRHFATALLLSLCLLLPTSARAEEHGVRLTHRTLQLATASSLLVTTALGTIAAINQPTLFSDGRCVTGDPIFGEYGCHGLSALHGLFAVVSLVLYSATTALEFARFDWPGRDDHGSGFEVLSYVQIIGMGLQPIGGLLAVVPEIIGMPRNSTFSRVVRTLHLIVGSAVTTSFVITTAIEL